MTEISAKIVCDSVSPAGKRITTMQLKYPRFVHAEFMTHRLFSRNASSSRAIPVNKIIEQVEIDPALPIHWGANQPGMQASQEVEAFAQELCEEGWLDARDQVVYIVRQLVNMGLHKQVANRLLEPWHHISVVCTATEYDNFFALRRHPDAQPEIKALANEMWDAVQDSTPTRLEFGEWHLPYIMENEKDSPGNYGTRLRNEWDLLRASVARCARVSYLNHDQSTPDLKKDIGLYQRLFESKHLSPFEHQAQPLTNPDDWSGNFKGWLQFRKSIKGEHQDNYEE